ncbi:voltage-dependent anion-selective channel protein 2-like [Scleropages formosus]|uniref:Non-selective voltage-gated ion channel VDAC2 n=1 Tax=Scleropages formosus TaxID=113540 RepID=A0A0P7VDH3_SCLFO|nr:voltage-dependent anion-selective channel protein 2-like [Scleropages formosus]
MEALGTGSSFLPNAEDRLGIAAELDVKTKPLIGLELKGSASCHPDTSTGDMIVEMKCKWSSYEVAFTEKLNADKTIGAEITVKDNIAKGLKIAFDTAFSLSTGKNGSEFGGSIYQKVADNLETAVSLLWTAGSISTRFGVAAKYQLDSNTSINAKVNNEGLVGLDYSQTLQPGKII